MRKYLRKSSEMFLVIEASVHVGPIVGSTLRSRVVRQSGVVYPTEDGQQRMKGKLGFQYPLPGHMLVT